MGEVTACAREMPKLSRLLADSHTFFFAAADYKFTAGNRCIMR
jgi:hypothetical protein